MARPKDPRASVELLRAAEAVFVERGLEDAKVEDITSRAGRSKGSFYLCFESKEDAFRRIVESMLARLAALFELEDRDLAPLDSMEAELERWVQKDLQIFEFLWQNRGVARMVQSGGCSQRFQYLVGDFAERARAQVKTALRRGQERGIFRADLDIDLASLFMSGAYDRVARELILRDRKPDLEAWLRSLQAMVVMGLGGQARPTARVTRVGKRMRDLRVSSSRK